ncbi:MAG: PD-(D/E)XK nuclease family protein [Candidatus Methanomethylophilaceae archaeon]
MRRAKSIQVIYQEVKDSDLVLTNDAPLATALNAMLDRPHLGSWAITPQQLARRESIQIIGVPIWDDLSMVTRLVELTGYDLKFVHGELEELRRMRRHTARMDEYIHTSSARQIWQAYIQLPCLEKVMTSFDPQFYGDKKVSVVGLDGFNDLDKHFLPTPDRFREIDPFLPCDYQIPEILEMGNDRDLARHVVDLIDAENMEDTAIVLNTQEPISDAIRSALYRKNIPFINSMEVRDLPGLRDLLEFMELTLPQKRPKMWELRPLLRRMGHFLSERWDNQSLEHWSKSTEGELRILADLLQNPGSGSFGKFLQMLVPEMERWPISKFLRKLGLLDRPVDRDTLDILRYALDHVEAGELDIVVPENEKQGVVLIDCKNSAYVDRAIVFYLGMSTDWSPLGAREEYMDAEAETEKESLRFQILMQQGETRFYIVKSSHRGKKVTPCLMFNHIQQESSLLQTFQDLCPDGYRRVSWIPDAKPRSVPLISLSEEPQDMRFYPSALNLVLKCPKAYMFSTITTAPEDGKKKFGTLLHSFAQFYVSYPELVRENGLDYYLDIFMDLFRPLMNDNQEDLESSKARLAMDRVMEFVDSHPTQDAMMVAWDEVVHSHGESDGPRRTVNPFFEHHGLDLKRANTEVRMESALAPLNSKLDLLLSPSRGVDYKTGEKRKISDMVKNYDWEAPTKYLDLQPLAYLEVLSASGNQDAELSFQYVLNRLPEAHLPVTDEDDRVVFRFTGMDRRDFIRSGALVEHLKVKYGCKGSNKVLRGDFEGLQSTLMDLRVWEMDQGWHESPQVLARFQEVFRENKDNDLAKTVRSCHELLYELRVMDGCHLVLKEDMQRLRELTASYQQKVEEWRIGVFPAEPIFPSSCRRKCDYYGLCVKGGEDE